MEVLSYAGEDVSQDAKYQNAVYVVITDERSYNPPVTRNRINVFLNLLKDPPYFLFSQPPFRPKRPFSVR